MPSRIEAFGQIALEALYCGTPCIVFKNTAMEDLVKHKSNGFICGNMDSIDLANGINWCLNNKSKFSEENLLSS